MNWFTSTMFDKIFVQSMQHLYHPVTLCTVIFHFYTDKFQAIHINMIDIYIHPLYDIWKHGTLQMLYNTSQSALEFLVRHLKDGNRG